MKTCFTMNRDLVSVFDYAQGNCIVCSSVCDHSKYWIATEQQWDPVVSKPVTSFRMGVDTPLCGPVCAEAYKGPSHYGEIT